MNCQYCGEQLTGRANQLYHYKCKIKHNNAVKKAREERRKTQLSAINHNYNLLNHFSTDEDVFPIEKIAILALGYDVNAVTRFYISQDVVFCFVFEYMFIWRQESTYLIVHRMKEDADVDAFTNQSSDL